MKATLSNACGNVVLDQYDVWVGKPLNQLGGKSGSCYEPYLIYQAESGENVNYNWGITGSGMNVSFGLKTVLVDGDIPDGTSRSFTLTVTTTENGCTTSKSINGVYYKPTLCDCGYNDPSCGGSGGPPSPLLVINPNPSGGEFNLLFSNVSELESHYGKGEVNYRVLITDLSGNEKYRGAINGNGLCVNLKHARPGLYSVKIWNRQSEKSALLLVE